MAAILNRPPEVVQINTVVHVPGGYTGTEFINLPLWPPFTRVNQTCLRIYDLLTLWINDQVSHNVSTLGQDLIRCVQLPASQLI